MLGSYKTVVFRADSSQSIGDGHVLRCLNLANEWKKQNVNTMFIFSNMQLSVRLLVKKNNHVLIENKVGADLQADLIFLKNIITEKKPSWVVLDGEKFNEQYQTVVKETGCKLFYINDFINGSRINADVLLNQNMHAEKSYYTGKVNNSTLCLNGPNYSLLHEDYSSEIWGKKDGEVSNILVTFGGSDTTNACLIVLEALKLIEDYSYSVTFLVPTGDSEKIKSLSEQTIHKVNVIDKHVKTILPYIRSHDLAIIAGGATTWEMACLGMPMIIMTLAENQRLNASKMQQSGLIKYVGDINKVSIRFLSTLIKEVTNNTQERIKMSHALINLVDGNGCKRVIEKINEYNN